MLRADCQELDTSRKRFQEMRNVLVTVLLTVLVSLFAYSGWVSPDIVAPPSQNGDRPHMATSSGK